MIFTEDGNNGELSDEDSSDDEAEPEQALPGGMPGSSKVLAANGRVRRRAVFGQQELEGHSSESDDEDDEPARPSNWVPSLRPTGGDSEEDGDDGDASDDSEGGLSRSPSNRLSLYTALLVMRCSVQPQRSLEDILLLADRTSAGDGSGLPFSLVSP